MLREEDWLHIAKRLPIGGKTRVYHGRERRPNLVIGHEREKYWAYCQACKAGAVHEKTHVLVLGASPEKHESNLTVPDDLVDPRESEHLTMGIGAYLASKGMDFKYLPELLYSPSRKRILLREHSPMANAWFGRDITNTAKQKWLSYSGAKYVLFGTERQYAVVVEDLFSAHKVAYARDKYDIPADIVCALGTGTTDSLLAELVRYSAVLFMFDGDDAGYAGAAHGCTRIRTFGGKARACCAPSGLDPKDLGLGEIDQHIMRNLMEVQ